MNSQQNAESRLISAQNAGANCAAMTVNGKTEYWGNSYGYDPWGNLINKTITKCGAENLQASALANNQLAGYGYDSAGNMISDPTDGFTATYDAGNMLKTVGSITYWYDNDGQRYIKWNNGVPVKSYFYGAGGEILAEGSGGSTLTAEYIFFNGKRLARVDLPSNAVHYYLSDALNSTSMEVSSAGVIENESDYYPWGGELQFVNNDPANPYKFTGKERDSETNLDYFGARYYSNGLGRFITPDWAAKPITVPYANFGNPQSLNLYAYTKNNPTTLGDPDGHEGATALGAELGTLIEPGVGTVAGTVIGGLIDLGLATYVLSKAAPAQTFTPGQEATLPTGESVTAQDPLGLQNNNVPPPALPTAAPPSNSQAGAVNTTIVQSKSTTPVGQSSSGQKINAYGEKFGGSGRPMRHSKRHSTRKAAKDAARQGGKTAPVEHGDDGHFHAADQDGEKIPNAVHHEYPK